MLLGVHYANFTHPDWESRLESRLTETARIADEGGVSLFTVMDHWFQMEDPAARPSRCSRATRPSGTSPP